MKRKILSISLAVLMVLTTNITALAAVMRSHSEVYQFEIGSSVFYENTDWGFSNGLLNVIRQGSDGQYKYGYVNELGNTVISFIYDEAEPFSEGYAVVCKYINGSPKYGYIDEKGNQVVDFIYDYAMPFSEGFAAVGNYTTGYYIKCGFIDTSGQLKIAMNYTTAEYFVNGLARVSQDKNNDGYPEFGYIDTSGNVKIALEYADALHFSDTGFAGVCKTINDDGDRKWAFINQSGTQVTQFIYDFADMYSEGFAPIGVYSTVYDYYEPRYGYVNESGRESISLNYSDASVFSEGLARVSNGTSVGYINTSGQLKISYSYSDGLNFSEGLCAVKVGSKWGYIDTDGNSVTQFVYDKASDFSEGYATVVYGGKTQVITNPLSITAPRVVTASATSSKVLVNGVLTTFESYSIDGYNYFKLRDLAAVSSSTEKPFDVTWNSAESSIELLSGVDYAQRASDMQAGDMTSKTATENTSPLYIDGERISITAYTISGNNFFKLRDICEVFDIQVTWDSASSTIGINHAFSY